MPTLNFHKTGDIFVSVEIKIDQMFVETLKWIASLFMIMMVMIISMINRYRIKTLLQSAQG